MTSEELIEKAFSMGLQQIRAEILALTNYVVALQPKHIMEIGCASGASFYLWSVLAAEDGEKISVDLPGGVYGGEEYADPQVRTRRDQLMQSYAPGVHLVAGNSHTIEIYKQVQSILGEDKVDFLFIDGDHTYEGVRADYLMYRDFVRSNGYIAFHDINDSEFHRANRVGVGRLWQELEGTKLEFNEHQDWAGIGVIQHP